MNTLNQIRGYALSEAYLTGLLVGPKIEELELPSDLVHQFADRIISDIEQYRSFKNIQDVKDELLKGFIYMFDKGVEISYFSRLLQDTKIEYNFDDLIDGMVVDTIPDYLQKKIEPIILVLGNIYNSTLKYINQNKMNADQAKAEELMKLLLVGGAFLGMEFCLRIELQKQSYE